ncbi:ABC transporter ATP-binding protein [Pseudonocardia sp. HH130630-07]|uniref:ABC transporter ATP-binding protein n=1 Tax=Pseudonocardia sp. HH130630-07 TaxID=1690815 RepID=UPI000814F8D6|nr:ABC transporter ATP-binding protein [Pseudonocardia sp. HH130630-07]ANY08990.1 multidrug ABC transporter ATP-binding protein [Pseudonocardia sp. HH130630-07]
MSSTDLDPATAGPGTDPVPAAPAARVRDLRKVFGSVTAVDGVDLDVPAGSVFGMLGPNGSGKTTLIRMLLGLTRPTSGTVELLGRPVPEGLPAALPDVGALVEGPGFHPFLSGRENLRRVAAVEPRLAAGQIRPAVETALDRVGLTAAAGRRFRGYSLGMKQRLGLAAALLVPRRLVVLDEPTNGLDPAGTREVRAVVAQLRDAGATVLLSSHLLAEVEAVCSHVAVLKHGSLLASGRLDRLLDAVAGGWEIATADVPGALHTLQALGATARADAAGVLVSDGPPAPEMFAALVRAEVPVHGLRRHRPDLETLFTRITES